MNGNRIWSVIEESGFVLNLMNQILSFAVEQKMEHMEKNRVKKIFSLLHCHTIEIMLQYSHQRLEL